MQEIDHENSKLSYFNLPEHCECGLFSMHLYDSAASILQFDVNLDADADKAAAVASDTIIGASTLLLVVISLGDDIFDFFNGS